MAAAAAAAALESRGDRWGARLVRRLPTRPDGTLDEAAVDALLVRVHSELARLAQEFAQPARLRAHLAPILDELRAAGHAGPLRVLDVGCGAGYTVRWLARHGDLGTDVELVGCDFNAALVAEARRLAGREGLACRFGVADAFASRHEAAVLTSAGVLHHFRGDALRGFFAAHDPAHVRAFVHYDVTPSPRALRWLGAWLFHLARMREPLSRHDGLASSMRTHPDAELAAAARAGAPWAEVALHDPAGTASSFVNVMRPVVGLDTSIAGAVRARLGPRLAPA